MRPEEELRAQGAAVSRRARRRVRWFRALGLVVLLALALRLLVCWELRSAPAVVAPGPETDMHTYLALARDIVAGQWPDQFYYQPFFYAVYLPLVVLLPGPQSVGLALTQSLIGALTVLLTGLVAARLAGRRAGLAAAFLLTVYRYHLFYTPFALMAVLQGFWLTLWVWLALRAWDRDRTLDWAWLGLVTCCGLLTRGTFLLFLPPALALLVWRRRGCPSRAAAGVALVLAFAVIPQLPFSWRNLRAHGRWTGPSTAQDAVLALGNTPEAPPGGLWYPPAYEEWMSTSRLVGEERVPVTHRMLAWMREEPLAWPELKLRALLLFWDPMEIPNNVALERDGRDSAFLQFPFLVGFGLVGVLAAAGLVCLLRRWRSPTALLCVAVVVIYWFSVALFYVLGRFRLPLVPLCCAVSGVPLARAWGFLARRDWRTRFRRRVPGAACAVLVGLALVWGGYRTYRGLLEARVLRLVRPHGVTVSALGSWRVYDHGPPVLGGWRPAPLDEVTKVFDLSRLPRDRADLARPVLRVALLGLRTGEVRVSASWDPAVRPVTLVTEIEAAAAPQWVELSLASGLADALAESSLLRVRVRVEALSGQGLPVLDWQRDYGRTRVSIDGLDQAAPAEACVELLFPVAE